MHDVSPNAGGETKLESTEFTRVRSKVDVHFSIARTRVLFSSLVW